MVILGEVAIETAGFWGACAYGFLGSILIELYMVNQTTPKRGGIRAKYKSKLFWGQRLLLAIASAFAVTAFHSEKMPNYAYVHLGAATPAILMRASKQDTEEDEDEENG